MRSIGPAPQGSHNARLPSQQRGWPRVSWPAQREAAGGDACRATRSALSDWIDFVDARPSPLPIPGGLSIVWRVAPTHSPRVRMKVISWNVNGIRAALKKGFLEFVKKTKPDILCLQETKAEPSQVDLDLPGYRAYWNAAEKKGYSGTAVFTLIEPERVTNGIGVAEHDREGRVITLEFEPFYLVNVYTPNSQRELTRLQYRQEWDTDFRAYLLRLERQKPVIFCGDLNVAHTEIDLANPKTNQHTHGFTPEERAAIDALVKAGFVDTFRLFTPGGGHYTWWAPFANARARNIGWRIDYFIVSGALAPRVKAAEILPQVLGSDHCPVVLELE